MSVRRKVTKFEEKKKSVGFVEKKLPSILGVATSETRTQPRFASHTQSSLMKTRTPINLKKSTRNASELNKPRESVALSRLSGVCKKRDSIKKQNRNIHALMTILKRQKNRRTSIFLHGSEVTEIFCLSEQCADNSLVSFSSDLINDVSRDLKRCTGSPAKLALRVKRTKQQTEIVDQPERTGDSHVFLQDEMSFIENSSAFLQSSLKDIRDIYEDYEDVARKLQLQSEDDEEELADLRREVKVHHRSKKFSKRMSEKDFSNKECSKIEIQMCQPTVSANSTTNRKYDRKPRKTWWKGKAVDGTNLQELKNLKFMKHVDDLQGKDIEPVVNDNIMFAREKSVSRKTRINQQSRKPPGVAKTSEVTVSLMQPVLQRSSQLIKGLTALTRNKHSSIEHINESMSASANYSKVLMKENRDPHTNDVTKIYKYIAEVKQQNVGTLPKGRRSVTKVASNVSNKCDDAVKLKSKSRLRHWYMQPIVPKRSSKNRNDIEQHHIESTPTHNKRSPSEVIHALKEFINSVKEDKDVRDNVINVSQNCISNHEKSDNKLLSNHDNFLKMESRNELTNLTKNKNLNGADRSFDLTYKSIGVQTKKKKNLSSSSYVMINSKKGDSKEILKSTRMVATQTSPSNKNTVEIGCNTSPSDIICKDVGISCDLIDLNSTAEVDLTVRDKVMTDVPIHTTEFSSIKYTEINVESEYPDESNETLNTQMSLKLENCNSKEILPETTNDFITEAEEIMHEETYRLFLKSPKNFNDRIKKTNIDEQQEFTEYPNNRDANNDAIANLSPKKSHQSSIYDYDASCSFDDITEYHENNVQYKNTIVPEFKVETIPRDVIAAFELAAERARNLYRAVIIYHENLIKESEKRDKKTAENDEAPKVYKDQRCFKKCVSFVSCENKTRVKSKCNTKSHLIVTTGENFDGSSTCSSCDNSSDHISEIEFAKLSKVHYSEIDREEKNAIVPRSERTITKSVLTEHFDIADVKSLVRHTQEYALELLQLEKDGNDESFEMEHTKILALPLTMKETSIISRGNLFLLVYCILCTIVFWFLQFLFRCDSAL